MRDAGSAGRNEGGRIEMMETWIMKRFVYLLAVLLASAFVDGSTMAQTSPFAGTWKLNVAKSKYEGTAAPKSLTRTVTAEGSGLKYSFEGVAADGSKLSYGFSFQQPGRKGHSRHWHRDARRSGDDCKVSDSKTEGILKKGGREIGRASAEVSKHGKTVTVKTSGKDANGKEVKSESVYEKQ
jgi:hypothetical protein